HTRFKCDWSSDVCSSDPFKPFVYLTAIEAGLTPDTVRQDGPLDVKGWKPENYTHEYFGPVTLTQALSMSLNTVAVRLGLEVGARSEERRIGKGTRKVSGG